MEFILFDLEATCWPEGTPGVVQEIIEIGAYRMNPSRRVTDSFHRMIRPVLHPHLSPYCRQLTGIEPHEIRNAALFPKVLEAWTEWLASSGEEYVLVSWGKEDEQFFRSDCRLHRQDTSWLDGCYYDLKAMYRQQFRLTKSLGLQAALRREGIEFEGTAHRAVPDARHLAMLFARHIDDWPIP